MVYDHAVPVRGHKLEARVDFDGAANLAGTAEVAAVATAVVVAAAAAAAGGVVSGTWAGWVGSPELTDDAATGVGEVPGPGGAVAVPYNYYLVVQTQP